MMRMAEKPDYYSTLGLKKEATREEVRTHYKMLAMQMHPDKNRDDPLATQKFQRLVEAYSVLTDPLKREQYDQFGTVDEEEEYDSDEMCECGQHHHQSNFEEFLAFRSFFTEMFNRHYKTHGFDGFVDDDDDDDETFVSNLWGSYGSFSRHRFAADWDSVPRAMVTEKQLKYQGTAPDKPGRPKATVNGNKIKVEWAKKNSSKEVLYHVLSMKTPQLDWADVYQGEEKSFEVTPVVSGNHSFRVCAGNRAGRSLFSEVVSVTVSVASKEPPKNVVTKSVSNGAQKKPEVLTKSVTPQPPEEPTKKKKNKQATDPRIPKLISDLKFSIEAVDIPELRKLLLLGNTLQIPKEHVDLITKATEIVDSRHMTELHKSLLEAVEVKNLAEIESILGQITMKPNFEKLRKGIERDLNRATQILYEAHEEQETREKVTKMLHDAMENRDLNRLNIAIDIAKKFNVPVREAKKFQRKLEKGDVLLEQLMLAAKNGDKLSLIELIKQAKEKNFPFLKELEFAQNKLDTILNEEESLLRELYGL